MRNDFRKQVDLLVETRARAEKDVDDFFEIEKPEWQLHVARAQSLRLVSETGTVFIVHVEHENAKVWSRGQSLLQNKCDAARFPDAGRPQNGEMLAQHFIYVDIGRDRGILVQMPDFNDRRLGDVVDHPKLVRADGAHRVADGGIFGHAATETGRGAVAILDFADDVDDGDRDEILVTGNRFGPQRNVCDRSDD